MKLVHLSWAALFLSLSSQSFAATGACHFPAGRFCYESTNIDLEDECKEDNGEFMKACPTADRFASCKVTFGQDLLAYLRYYKGASADAAMKNCTENKGEYIAD